MKSLKFDHSLAQAVRSGEKTSTWRIYDDKDLSVDDEVAVIDKVDPKNKDTWTVIGALKINQVVVKRLKDVEPTEINEHDLGSKEQMYAVFQKYYGTGVGPNTHIKIINFSFQTQDQLKKMPKVELNPSNKNEIKMYADGGSRGNPGPSASGYVLFTMDDEIIESNGVYLGITTNNQAEYHALKAGLEEAQKVGARIVHVYMDSLLVVNQMIGKFKVKNRDLWPVYQSIKDYLANFEKVEFNHVPRELNRAADAEVNRVLDSSIE